MLELHIWGPAFSLPSIDPQCNAAVAYLNVILPKDEWTVIASSNPLLSPTRQLPALRDGMIWTAGFRGIVEYVRKKSNGSADLDVFLDDIQRAECTAFSAFIETHGQALIDLSLYVSRKNFDGVTRSTYATLLPFPMQYYTPVVIRSQAKTRTAGLSVTALDIDASESSSSATAPVGIPHTAIPTPAAKTSILTATEAAATFKLMNIVRDFLHPLQTRIDSNRYFFGSDPSTLDCLAVGYLSLCLYPELPHPWLANEMKKGFGKVCGYLNGIRIPTLSEPIDVKEVLAYTKNRGEQSETTSGLPWGIVERGDLPWVTGFLLNRTFDAIGWGHGARIQKKKQQERDQAMDPRDLERKRNMEARIRSQRISGVLTVAGGVAAFLGYCFWSGLLQIEVQDRNEEDEGDKGEKDEENLEDEDEDEDEDEYCYEDEDGYIHARGGGPSDSYGLAGDILGLRRPPMTPDDLKSEETKDGESLSAEEEEEIAKDIHAEEVEINEEIARDVEEHIKGKDE